MLGTPSRFFVGVIAVLGGFMSGCDSSVTAPKTRNLVAEAADSTLSLQAGKSLAVPITILRTGYSGPVTLDISGAPAGLTAAFDHVKLAAGENTATLTLSAERSVSITTPATMKIVATAPGVTPSVLILTLAFTAPEDFTLVVQPTALSMQAGGSDSVHLSLNRTNGFTGPISIALSGVPSGVTATVAPAVFSPSDTSGTLTITAPLSIPGGSRARIRVTATAANINELQVDVSVMFTAHTTRTSITFCGSGIPAWFAYQNEGAEWVRVVPSGGTFTFDATDKVATAYVVTSGTYAKTTITFATPAELTAAPQSDCLNGTRTVRGKVDGIEDYLTTWALVSMGTHSAFASASNGGYFTLSGLPDGPLDLVATRMRGGPERVIIRRDLNPADGSMLPVIDFNSQETIQTYWEKGDLTVDLTVPVPYLVNYNYFGSFTTANGTTQATTPLTLGPSLAETHSIPSSLLVSGDMHAVGVVAAPIAGSVAGMLRSYAYYHTPANQTLYLGPRIGAPAVRTLSQLPYARLEVQSANYGSATSFDLEQPDPPSRSVILIASRSYSAAVVGDVQIPDFTGVSGWDNTWALNVGVTTTVSVFTQDGRPALFFGARPLAGEKIKQASGTRLVMTP